MALPVSDKENSASGKKELPPQQQRKRRRWLRRMGIALLVAGALYLLRAPILTGLASVLVFDRPLPGAETIVLFCEIDGDRGFQEAAQLHQDGQVSRILLIEVRAERRARTVRAGVVPSFETTARQALLARGVPAAAIELLPADMRSNWDKARSLDAWLQQHPEARATVLCERFASRRIAQIYSSVLGPESSGRLGWRAIPDRRFDESNWWQQRLGVLAVFHAYAHLGHVWISGEGPPEPEPWDPDDYEKSLQTR